MKLFPKWVLLFFTLLIGTSAGLGWVFYRNSEQQILDRADSERQTLLKNLSHMTRESLLTNDDLLLINYTGSLLQWNPFLVSAWVATESQEIVAHTDPSLLGTVMSHAPLDPELLQLTQKLRLGAADEVTVTLQFSQRAYKEWVGQQVDRLRFRLVLIGSASLLVGLALAFLVTRSWTRPISQLASAAAAIGKGSDAHTLTPLLCRRDEMGLLARAFEVMTQDLKKLNQMKEDFVAAVTHELRSPLGAIESYLHLMAQEMHDGQPAEVWNIYLARLRVNTQRLTHFVNDLLDVAALERGKVTAEKRPTDVVQLVKDVVGLFEVSAAEKSLRLTLTHAENLPLISLDPEKTRQILINLLSNALKFTPSPGDIQVFIVWDKTQGLQMQVRDSGLGISAEDQKILFNKFAQVASARSQVKGPKGTGLGLALSRQLAELQGGQLEVTSDIGKGSLFTISFPA